MFSPLALLLLFPLLTPAPCLVAPVDAPVVDTFREPACTWCPGNRGIEYATVPGQPVRSPMQGRVSYAGVVAGTRYVVVERMVQGGQPGSAADTALRWRVTLGGLATSGVGLGDEVAQGAVVATSGSTLHFGVRRGDEYVDPAPLLAELRTRPRLVPLDGQRRLPAPPAVMSCPVAAAGASGGQWGTARAVR